MNGTGSGTSTPTGACRCDATASPSACRCMGGWCTNPYIDEPNKGVYRGIRKTDPDDPDLFKAKWGKQWVDRMRQDWR